MPEYRFILTVEGSIEAADEEEARLLLKIEPAKWGAVDIEGLEEIPDDWFDDEATE